MRIDVNFQELSHEFAVSMESGPAEMQADMGEVQVIHDGGTLDHARLTNREAPEQHPIGAITDLRESLDGLTTPDEVNKAIEDSLVEMTNQDVLKIWNSILGGN